MLASVSYACSRQIRCFIVSCVSVKFIASSSKLLRFRQIYCAWQIYSFGTDLMRSTNLLWIRQVFLFIALIKFATFLPCLISAENEMAFRQFRHTDQVGKSHNTIMYPKNKILVNYMKLANGNTRHSTNLTKTQQLWRTRNIFDRNARRNKATNLSATRV